MRDKVNSWKEAVTRDLEDVQKEGIHMKEEQLLIRNRMGELEGTTAKRMFVTENNMEVLVTEKCSEIDEKVAEAREDAATFLYVSLDKMKSIRE